MLKLFLLIPFITLNVAMTLGLIYYTVFINSNVGLLISFITVIALLVPLSVMNFEKGLEGGQDNA